MDCFEQCQGKIALGNQLLGQLASCTADGVSKLQKKIIKEIKFLEKVCRERSVKAEHVLGTNLNHYQAVVSCVGRASGLTAILELFTLELNNGECKKLCVDIVSDSGCTWTKVIARNPKAILQISNGEGSYGQKSILCQAEEYVLCASQHTVAYEPPTVEFFFSNGIDESLSKRLEELQIRVGGELTGRVEPEQPPWLRLAKLNLDVSTLLAYVSAQTNGHAHCKIKGKVLAAQAQAEQLRPVRPGLDQLFQGKELYVCQTVLDRFRYILGTVGGAEEKTRGDQLISRLHVVADAAHHLLIAGGQRKDTSLPVFATGIAIKALTVTANAGFLRSARTQGVHIDAFIHESRALTEQKEYECLAK